ncbi:MAG TPA: nicotinate-nucleotide adenylyltransferase [Tissierellaceae bacterium]|nr:nicotinate-nucleotide adenylyltransferase [Tissierellaceae bacterium]
MKIGIMGGTFDPIHNGHLILSEYIREKCKLDKVIFIPTGKPPHKNLNNISDNNIRKKMVELAIESNPNFAISTIEMDSVETSYTIDTIKELKNIYDRDELYIIIGGDSLLNLETWKDYKELISIANIIVADRYTPNMEEMVEKIKEFNNKYNGNIVRINTPIIHISSTIIRKRVKEDLSIKYLLPDILEKYIIKNHLYK